MSLAVMKCNNGLFWENSSHWYLDFIWVGFGLGLNVRRNQRFVVQIARDFN